MSKALKAKHYTKEKTIIAVILLLVVGFVTGILFIIQIDKVDINQKNTIAYQCNKGDILYLGDLVCGDEFGNNTYTPTEVHFNEIEYLSSSAAYNVYDVIPLLLEYEIPKSLKGKDKFYIVKDTSFVVVSSTDVKSMNDFLQK